MEADQVHPAASMLFQNQDIIPIILSLLDPEAFYWKNRIRDMKPSTRTDLRSAALACKAFFEPAISLLWRKLDSLMPILKLISSFCTEDGINYTMDSMTPEDYQLLDIYSKHVRYLYLVNFGKVIKGHVLHRLSLLTKPLLPNLQRIYITKLDRSTDYRGRETTDVIFLALGKSLTTLSISGIDAVKAEDVASYLSVLDEKKALLQDIRLGGFLTHDTLTLLNCFSNIKFLDLNLKGVSFGSTAIRAWSTLPFLVHLAIYLDFDSNYETESLELGGIATRNAPNFRALQRYIFGGQPAEALKIIKSIGISETLTYITLEISVPASWSTDVAPVQSATLSDCIAECARIGPSLECLIIRVAASYGLRGPFLTLSEQSILALSSGCQQLREIRIMGVIHLAANDYTIDRVCANGGWKRLRLLYLPGGVDDMALSLLSLNTIAMNCPDLMDLKISVDFCRKNSESLESERKGLKMSHRLRRLCLVKHKSDAQGSDNVLADINTVEMTIGVSRFFEYLFPNLNPETIALVSTLPADQKWWEGVRSLMSVYRTIRQEALPEFGRSESEAM